MSRARKTPPPAGNDNADTHAKLVAALVEALRGSALVTAFRDPAILRALGVAIAAELRRTHGSLQENAAHAGFSESYFSKLIKNGLPLPVNRVSNNCVRIKFADTDAAIEKLSSGKGAQS